MRSLLADCEARESQLEHVRSNPACGIHGVLVNPDADYVSVDGFNERLSMGACLWCLDLRDCFLLLLAFPATWSLLRVTFPVSRRFPCSDVYLFPPFWPRLAAVLEWSACQGGMATIHPSMRIIDFAGGLRSAGHLDGVAGWPLVEFGG